MTVREGRVTIHAGERSTDVGPGQVAAVAAGHRWWAEASDDSVLLLNLSWPPEPGSAG